MPIPFILGGIAAIAAATGVAKGVSGAKKMSEAKKKIERANERHQNNLNRFDKAQKKSQNILDSIGKMELETLKSFKKFQDLIEQIQGRPEFKSQSFDKESATSYTPEELKEASIGAELLLAGLSSGGAVAGAIGAVAAGGAASAAVAACGTLGVAASTGTAIASLSGAAATNAALAALGGGTLAAGGGGVALGSMVLGAGTLGIGLLVGGWIMNSIGSSLSDKADEAWSQMKKAETEINKVCKYLDRLSTTAQKFGHAFRTVDDLYKKMLSNLDHIITQEKRREWSSFSPEEKLLTQNTVLLVGLLYNMTKVKLILKNTATDSVPQVNDEAVYTTIHNTKRTLEQASDDNPDVQKVFLELTYGE